MASKLLSERTKTILYWTAIIILFALFLGFLVAYIKKQEPANEVPPTEPPPTTPTPPSEEEIRLDDYAVPHHYRLEVTSDHENDRFSGIVSIDFEATETIAQVKLHCKNLQIQSYKLTAAASGVAADIIKVDIDSLLELCVFHPKTSLAAGNYSLRIEYSGEFKSGQIIGFYKSSYTTVDNQIRYLTATKFEPTYARLAFPAFDEPRWKSTYDISVVHKSSLIALSNEDEQSREDVAGKDGWKRTTFKRTVPMATYMVAFIVSDFKYTETRTTNGLRVRVYSRPDQVSKTRYATETAAQVLRYYENYTGISYPLSKLDLVGLPEFVSGAMEQYGICTFKETYVLYSETESSAADMKSIASVISHELSHMWFGNLVTLKWWDHLWLNEGFASYIEFKGQDSVNKSWNVNDLFLSSDLQASLRADSQKSARPIVSPVLTPDQITSIFDQFSYGKAASILYMIENVIGQVAFQTCSRNYLNAHKYGVAETADMISAYSEEIKKATGIEGQEFIEKYLYSNGYAIVTVERAGTKSLKLTQSAYNANSSTALDKPWNMKVTYRLPNNRIGSFVMSQVSQTVALADEIAPKDWFKLNADSTGYYIVNYQTSDWNLLIAQLKLKPTLLSVKDRASILFDASQLSDKALLGYETLFSLFDYLKSESDYLPWSVASTSITSIQSKLRATSSSSIVQFNAYIRDLVGRVYDSNVVFDADPATMTYNQLLLRNSLISLACRVDYEKCTIQASALFRDWLDNGARVDANIRSYVYKYGLQASTDDNDWLRVWDLYQSEKDALEKSKLMSALTGTTSSTMLTTLIAYSRNQSIINNENFFSVQQNIASNSEIGRSLVWDYIKNEWAELVRRFGLNDRRLGNYVKSVTSGFGTATRLQEMEDFFQREPEAGAGASARLSALEAVRRNIEWFTDNGQKISNSLSARDQYAKPWLNWRLDKFVFPSHYDLILDIDLEQEKFSGSVAIQVDVQRPIRYLILHAKDLQITASNVYTKQDKTLVSTKGFGFELNQFWVIEMSQIISSGHYIAELSFKADLTSSLSGLYISRYNSSTTGEMTKLATTQMEAGYARKAFPCFDEPSFKSTFTISITHGSKYNAISNMPVDYIQSSQQADKRTTVFKKSVRMSTYLVAFVVSDFVSKKSPLSPNFSVYTYNPEINLPKTDYALTVGPKLLDYLAKDYFKIAFPLPKLDMISIPDFSMGAMENWGLITYRDAYILYDESESTSASKMTVCSIVAHEEVHSWFGNFVTMKWWDQLWLNEGFAQFMQYKATDAVEPDWKYLEHFAIKELSRVFDIDSSLATHPIVTHVNDENDMQAVFDPVTYAKGASVIRMLENTLTAPVFQQALINYLNKYVYSNAATEDLIREFSNVLTTEKLDVGAFLDSWINKDGFPVVTLNDDGDGTFTFKQERFLKDYDHSNASYTWHIPLTYRVFDRKNGDLDNPIGRFSFSNKSAAVTIPEYTADSIIKFNVDQTGLYILNYPRIHWNRFINLFSDNSSLAWKKLSVLDRSNLISDSFYLSRSGRLPYELTLKLASSILRHERSFIVWTTASDMLRFLRNFAITQDRGIAFNQWLLNNGINSLYDEVGWEPLAEDDLNRRQLRALILDLACMADHELCLNKASEKFEEFRQQASSQHRQRRSAYKPDPDTFNVFLYHTMRTVKSESDEKFDFLMLQYQSALSTSEKMRFLRALAAVQSPVLLTQLVDRSLNTEFVRAQDYFTFLSYIASNPVGLDIAWKSYRDNFQTIQDRFGLDDSNLGRAVYRFSTYFNSPTRRQEVLDFYAQYPKAGASELYRQQSLELLDANLQWSKKFYSPVIEHLTTECDSKICPWNVYRLNDRVVPSTYDITIQVNTNTNLYNGTVKAAVSVHEQVKYIIMHAASILQPRHPIVRLNPSTAVNGTKHNGYAELTVLNDFRYEPLEFYVIELGSVLEANSDVVIEVSFEGNLLLGGTVGLYRGYYEDNGITVNLAATQFESTHARKVFPMFDEPHFKQVIDMKIIHEESMNTTLSNMPISSTKPYDPLPGWMITTYDKSVKMVSYLIAILVSDFQCTSTEVTEPGRSPLKISTCASKVHHLKKHEYSLDVTPKIIKHYETLLDYKYQLDKLDQIALPQFSPGAMENWGLVKYREKMLLWTEDEETSAEQRSIVAVISHELGHMWFGNLATCDFWGDLWLNEAFASYMEFSAVASVHPEWNYFDTIAFYDQFNAILSDSSESSQPIVRDVTSPALMGYSSAIVYNKGSSILHSFNNTMGPDKFKLSLQQYLKANEYQTVVTSDLFSKFADNWDYPEQNITEFMRSWTYQPGFPYLNITVNSDNTYTVTQERFLQSGARPTSDLLYIVPFSYYSFDAKTKKLRTSQIQFLGKKTTKLPGEFANFVKFNPGFNHLFLTNYPQSYWTELSQRLLNNENDFVNQLMVNDRAELVFSSFLLARAKLTPYLVPFQLYNYLVNEKHYVPWYYFDYALRYLALRIDRTEYRESLLQFERRLTLPHYKGIDFWNDTIGHNLEKSFRQLLITITCRSGNEQCLADAFYKFSIWVDSNADPKTLPPNLRVNTLCYGIRASTSKSDYQFVWKQFQQAKDDSPLKLTYLQALSFITDQTELKRYIDLSLDESIVSKAQWVTFFNYVIQNYAHESMAWQYFVDNVSMLQRKLSPSQMNSIVSQFASYAVTNARKLEISSFLSKTAVGTESGRKTALDTINSNIAWMATRKTEVGEWLTQNACGDKTPKACPWGSLRIAKNESFPLTYDLVIQVNVTTYVYNGTVDVTVETASDLDFLTLNAASMLAVDLVSVTGPNGKPVEATMFRYTPAKLDYVVVRFETTQPAAQYVLRFAFKGNLIDGGLSGLYLSNYTDASGREVGLASTQFEFYDARKVVVSYDEPAFKSNYTVTIIRDKKMSGTLSNMDVDKETTVPGTDWVQTKYKPTPPMVSYLLAMLISDFVCKQQTENGVRYGVCAAPTQKHKMDYALSVAPKCMQHMETITGIKYPLSKVDLVAIPAFSYGAMENWGLITFRETALLYSDADTTSASKMSIASIIAHEENHQWFGNLVTTEWWSSLFLNEAFATYFEYTTVNAVEPSWHYLELFLLNFESAINADSVDTVHPILRQINTTQQIDQFSSNIIYGKGSSVLRMLAEGVMGVDKFYDSIRQYLSENAYKTVTEDDLFRQLDRNFPSFGNVASATDFLQEWIKEKGFPVVTVQREANRYRVRQQRFLLSPGGSTSTVWKIPLFYYNDAQWTQPTKIFITKAEEELVIEPPATGLIKFNAGHTGFFLVNYPLSMWLDWIDALTNKFNTTNLPVADRAGLLLDSFYLARGNLLSYTIPLKLARYLVNEDHITPWTLAIRALNLLSKNVILGSSYGPQFQAYIRELVEPIYSNLGWDDSNGNEVKRRLRATILDFACSNNHEDCLSQSKRLFQQFVEGKTSNDDSKIPKPNLLSIVLKYGLRADSTNENWLFIWAQYLKETSASLKSIYLNALANTPDQGSISMLLDQALEAKVIRPQDASSVFSAVVNSRNPKSIETLWQFFKANYQRFAGPGSPLRLTQLSSILNGICNNYFFTVDRKAELLSFFAQNPTLGLSSSQRTSAINTIDSNIAWITTRKIEVENFLLCNDQSCPFTEFRLSPLVYPDTYNLSLSVDLESGTFSGSVNIATRVIGEAQNLRYLTVTAASTLNITASRVLDTAATVTRTFFYEPYQFWVLELDRPVQSSNVELQFEFNSKLSTDMAGFYLSEYYDPATQKMVKLAATQFQATDSRRCFPGFDEPQFKSEFYVTLTYKKQYTATMSNNKISSQVENADGTVTTTFDKSPKMVTYLLAFIVSDFTCDTDSTVTGTELRVCASPPQADMIAYPLSVAPKLLEAFNSKFQISYSSMLPKMDIVAIPDFSAGAMENWGLLTFRETALLWNENVSSAYDKQRVASVLAHEIAHDWTGNLVTCEWWSDLWINEAFASFLEWFSVDSVETEWNYKQLFYTSDSIPGLNADASLTAHPLVRSVKTPSDIPYVSNIIYQKGSAVLRMFEFVFTSDKFFSALAGYLQANKYTSVSSSVILDAFSTIQVDNLNSSEFVKSWTTQAGFPLITITSNGDANSYIATQERFLATGRITGNSQTWVAPLSYYKNYQVNTESAIEFLTDKSQNITIQVTGDSSLPVKFNVDSLGFYIVNYPLEDWQKWVTMFNDPKATADLKFTSQDYSHLLFDAFALSGVNLLPYTVSLDLTSLLRHKEDFSVWNTGSTIFSQLWPNFRSSDVTGINALMQSTFRVYAQGLVRDLYNKYGLQSEEPESVMGQRLRSEISSFACAYGLDQCLLEAQVEFKKWRTQGTALSPNVRATVLRYAIQASQSTDDWHYLWTQYTEAWQTSIKLDYLQALAQTSNKELLNLLFDRANDQKLVRRQDYLSLYSYAVRTQTGYDVAWNYFTTNYNAIRANRLTAGQIGSVASYFSRYLKTGQQKSNFQQFFLEHPGISTTNLNKALEAIDKNIAWAGSYRQSVYDWLRNKNSQTQR